MGKNKNIAVPHKDWGIDNKRIEAIENFLARLEVTVYPSPENRYKALKMAPKDVKVVILGQDPYHDGSATGLAFDNIVDGDKMSPSLRNIITEMVTTWAQDNYVPTMGYDSWLGHLADQGVLLLNTALSVEKGKPNSHSKYWENVISELLQVLNKQDDIVYLSWGSFAHEITGSIITNPTAVVIKTTHPSPFSARKASNSAPAFLGSGCFEKVNNELVAKGKTSINW